MSDDPGHPELVPFLMIDVLGLPGPQGSKNTGVAHNRDGSIRIGRNGKPVTFTTESSAKVKPWRDAVSWEARQHLGRRAPLSGAAGADITFYMPCPQRAPKFMRWQHRTPDLDKLVRSTFDGLKEGGAWADDARCVSLTTTKYLSREGVTGAHIVLWDLDPIERAGCDLIWVPRLVVGPPHSWRPTTRGGAT